MTPDDVAAIRAEWADSFLNGDPLTEQIRTLCDALEAAWAERDGNAAAWDSTAELLKLTLTRIDRLEDALKQQVAVTEQRVEILRERAERAEAEVARLNVIIFDNNHAWARDITARNEAQCALARVRALCDGRPTHDYLEVARIRAAIEGDNP